METLLCTGGLSAGTRPCYWAIHLDHDIGLCKLTNKVGPMEKSPETSRREIAKSYIFQSGIWEDDARIPSTNRQPIDSHSLYTSVERRR